MADMLHVASCLSAQGFAATGRSRQCGGAL